MACHLKRFVVRIQRIKGSNLSTKTVDVSIEQSEEEEIQIKIISQNKEKYSLWFIMNFFSINEIVCILAVRCLFVATRLL